MCEVFFLIHDYKKLLYSVDFVQPRNSKNIKENRLLKDKKTKNGSKTVLRVENMA